LWLIFRSRTVGFVYTYGPAFRSNAIAKLQKLRCKIA